MKGVRTSTLMNRASIRVVERDHQPWFVAVDVCTVPGTKDQAQSTRYLDEDEER